MTRAQLNAGSASSDIRTPSRRVLGFFSVYLAWYLRRHFHAVRVANAGRIPPQAEPLILFANHASWWDPLIALVLGREILPDREHYAPMDGIALDHYRIFRPMGFFPVDNRSSRGATQLLRAGEAIFSRPGAVLWVTPEGQFHDVRTRPVIFRSGVGGLISRRGRMTCVPVAIEYTFWNERLPEVLVNVGEPLEIADGTMEDSGTWTNLLSYAMAATLDELTLLVTDRDPDAFETILSSQGGDGGFADLWRRLTAAITGRSYHHEDESLDK
jgi:1-acyl-sn-glycerol-3-phosphate acyltransferase